MAGQNPPNLEQVTHGIILRTSTIYSGRYAYFPLPRAITTEDASNLDNIFADSLTNAPHFPDITILDSLYSNILYQTHNSFPNFFHVYNLINQSHFAFPFPYLLTFVNAAILIRDSSNFEVLVVCINEHPNPLFVEEGDNRIRPLVFYLYTSARENWSLVPINFALTADHLLPNRRKPTHVGEGIVCLDLTDRLLVTYAYSKGRIKKIKKMVSKWERESNKLDEGTRFVQCRGQLHCVKYNPIDVRIEAFKWMARSKCWRLVVAGQIGNIWGKVVGIHPDDEAYMIVRAFKDVIFMVDILRDLIDIIIEGRGPNCSDECHFFGMNDVLEATTSQGVQRSSCGILHPHENMYEPEGEVFIVSYIGTQLISPPQNVC